MFGTLELKSRPLRLGFLVNLMKPNSVKRAIEINSTLWGGTYNPIIPVYKGTPRNWESPFRSPKPPEIVKGYVDAFDPDVLVQCTQVLPEYIKDLGLEIIQTQEIWEKGTNLQKEVYPKIGIGIFELCNEIYDEYFRYQAKYPPKIIIPKIPRTNALFWSSVFGVLPSFVTTILERGYKKALEIETHKIDISKLENSFKGDVWFPRRITQYALKFHKRSGFRNEDCIFFMDITKSLDIIDYWNLRALGRHVIPLPIQLKEEKSLRDIVIDVLKASRRPLSGNPKLYNHATFICSRNSKIEDMEAFSKTLGLKGDQNDPVDEPFYYLQHWYPRIWDEWARSKDGAEADDIWHEERDIDLSDVNDKVHLRFIRPKFADSYLSSQRPKLANEITFRLYTSDKIFAQVYPKSQTDNLIRLIGGLVSYRREWRVGRNGVVKLTQAYERTEDWPIPLAQDVFAAWMKDLGYEVAISTPGLLAKQIYAQFEGSTQVLLNESLLKLFERMNSGNDEGKELHVGELKNRLGKNLLDYLLSKNVFRVGLKIQCANCKRNSWYSLDV